MAVLLPAIVLVLHRWLTTSLRRRNEELMKHVRERERAELTLRRSEERFRSLIENGSDLICVVGADGNIRYASPSSKRILGYDPAALVGKPVRSLLDRSARDFADRLRGSTTTLGDTFRVRGADGEWVSLEIVAKLDSDGEQVVINCRDTTERVLLQQQLEQARRLSSLGRLAATVSHEFNNVLMGIQPFLYVLRRHAPDDEYIQNVAAKMELSLKRGKQITSQILRYTRPSQPSIEEIRTSEWFGELMPELHGLLTGVDLEIQVSADQTIAGDRAQLTQVMINLAINARDAIAEAPGRIVIRCTEETSRRFPFGVVEHPERFVHISVSDNGRGIAEEVLPQIFEPLFTTKRERGTGLGLAIVHQVIGNHGGMVFVESAIDAGTTFHLFLPKMIRPDTVEQGGAPATISIPTRLQRVLIVEDEPAVADGLAGLLRIHNVDVRVVERAAGAAAALEEFHPDVVVMDVALPDGDGIDLYRSLLSIRPRLPVVFSTAHETRDRLADLLEEPHVSFLQKPYDENQLLAELSRCV
jgi:PAS domain S-box-containing protein